MKTKTQTLMVFGLGMMLALAGMVSADTIFFEDFETGSLNNWELWSAAGSSNWTVNVTDPYEGMYHARANPRDASTPAAILEQGIDTRGYRTITLRYYRKLVGIDGGDEYRVRYYDGTSWHIIEATGSNASNDVNYTEVVLSLPEGAEDNADFRIRFDCTAQAQQEFCNVDNVELLGDQIQGYSGHFEYVSNYSYDVMINQTHALFVGVNASNSHERHVLDLGQGNGLTRRINYVWFYGWHDAMNLYLNQYIGLGISNTLPTTMNGGVYSVTANTSTLATQHLPPSEMLTIEYDPATQEVTLSTQGQSITQSLDPVWGSAGFAFGSYLFEVRPVTSAGQVTFLLEEWQKEDLLVNGLLPRWTIELTPL